MRFIKFYRVVKADDNKYHLCLRDKVNSILCSIKDFIFCKQKEVKACYDIYRVRDDLHRRAYQHPVVKGLELM